MSRGGEGAGMDMGTVLAGEVPLWETRLEFAACGVQST